MEYKFSWLSTLSWICIVLVDYDNSPQVDISLDSTLYTDPETTSRSLFLLLNVSYLAEKQHIHLCTNFILWFDQTQSGYHLIEKYIFLPMIWLKIYIPEMIFFPQ
jgi:hypothetical protein